MSTASPPLIDSVLHGRYRVDAHMAEGGMASVYQGHDLRLDRPVALKIMRPDLARDLDFVARFRREARSAAKLAHPHVVSVYDQGEDDGLVYLVMELVPGRNLRETIHDDAPLTIRQATAVVDQILQALGAAHRAGLVHRDIKPENVLTDQDGSVKVADFGLARAVTAGAMSRTSDVMWGTAAYLSPEQVQHGRADERTDVYAVALILYELLTGTKAFGGHSPIHVAFQHVHESVPSVGTVLSAAPAEVDAFIARASATDPDERPADAIALRDALTRMAERLSDEELDAVPVPVAGAGAGASGAAFPPGPGDATRPVHQATAVVPVGPAGTESTFARTTGNRAPRSAGDTPAVLAGSAGKGGRRRSLGVVLAVLLLVIGGGGAGATWYFTAGPGIRSDVPTLVGLSQDEAVTAVQDVDLVPEVTPGFSETAPPGTVISSSRDVGTSLRHGTAVGLEVSAGPERYPVPDLTRRTVDEASAELTSGGLELGAVTEDFDDEVEEGLILRSSPAATDDPVAPDTAVDVVLSSGPEPIEIPDVTGSTRGEAERVLREAGFATALSQERANDPQVPEGSVVSQSPVGGQGRRGDEVRLTLSGGPALVSVPRVTGMPFREARARLEDLGLRVKREEIASGLFETVRSQSVEAGEQVPQDTQVVLRVL